MADTLSAEALMQHIRALADDIGPRPAGTPREQWAHDYVRDTLAKMDLTDIETLPFQSPSTWGYSTIIPAALALAGNLVLRGRFGRLLSGGVSLVAAESLYRTFGVQRSWLVHALQPTGSSSTQVVRIAPRGEVKQKLVFIGHVDANRHRLTFAQESKNLLQIAGTTYLVALVVNGLVQLARAMGPKRAFGRWYGLSLVGLVTALAVNLLDEQGEYIDGANDNATAVACVLGLAGYFKANPLANTEVWLAFTGAEEVGLLGTYALLDKHGDELRDATFIDYEMVGAGDLAYVTHHSSWSHVTGYAPDPHTTALVAELAREKPEFGVTGKPMLMTEEVGALRRNGYRGLCLVGVGVDGFLVNWHRNTDISANIDPAKVEKAARFGVAIAEKVDASA